VLVVVNDLLFRSKIDEVARRLGLELRVARSLEQLERHLARGEPAVTFVDLEADSLDTSAAIRRIREAPWGAAARIVGFAGHTNVNAIRAGRAAGAGVVLARSAFTAQLPELLGRVADEERGRASGE
jgi:CheY-like chemotaxis protein